MEYLTSDLPDDEWLDTLEASLKTKTIGKINVSLKKIGGFSLLYGQLAIDPQTHKIHHLNIMSNRGDHGKVHSSNAVYINGEDHELSLHNDIAHETTFGLSNSLYYDPWPKVELGKSKLKDLVNLSEKENLDHKQLINGCFEILSHDTFDAESASKTPDINEKFKELRKSIFIPPLKTDTPRLSSSGTTSGVLYGTRTQTVIALHKSGKLHYHERDLHDSDNLDNDLKVREKHFEFFLPNKT